MVQLEACPGSVLVYMVELEFEGQCPRKEYRIVQSGRVMRYEPTEHGIVANGWLHWLREVHRIVVFEASNLYSRYIVHTGWKLVL